MEYYDQLMDEYNQSFSHIGNAANNLVENRRIIEEMIEVLNNAYQKDSGSDTKITNLKVKNIKSMNKANNYITMCYGAVMGEYSAKRNGF